MSRRGSKARRRPKAHPQGVIELTPRGYGFVKTAEGEYFISARHAGNAFPGDLVEIAPLSAKDRYERSKHISQATKPNARVVKVLMRAQSTIIGRYEIAEPFGIVVPEDHCLKHDIFTLRKDSLHVCDGDLVECEILDYPTRNSAATGRILRVLGHEGDSNVGIDIIIAENGLETSFSKQVLDEAEYCSLKVDDALKKGYQDLRHRYIFTIDPVDARDFDDAISIERVDSGYKLGVHIADVSHYVPFNSALDLAARRRGTSVYLVDRVLPMLPEAISNELCSLVPDQDRLAVSVDIELTDQGTVTSYEVFPSVIRSKARLSYDQAQALLDEANSSSFDEDDSMNDSSNSQKYSAFKMCDMPAGALSLHDEQIAVLSRKISDLNKLAKALFRKRYKDGCMDFDKVEARMKLDPQGTPIEITFRRKTDATEMIEESMILANHLVAMWLTNKQMPCMYRVHDVPDGQALMNLYELLQEFSLFKNLDKRLFCDGNPKTLQKVLATNGTSQQNELIHTLLLRSMKRALYSAEDNGHYGLALDCYCHFTSPIRRYPDLYVHRMIKEAYFGKTHLFDAQKDAISWIADHASTMERVSDKAQYQSQKLKLIEYMQGFIGMTYDAVISSVSTFGLSVRLENTCTGRVPIRDLGDEYFAYDPIRYTLTGSDSGKRFRLGQSVKVELVEANPRLKRVLFRLA